MKVRKLNHNRRGVAADVKHLSRAYLSREDAALLLHVSREYFESLVRAGELVASGRRRGEHPMFAIADVRAYKTWSKAKRRAGLTRMMGATQRLGLYDAELEDVSSMPALRGTPDDEVISTSDAAKLLFVSRPHAVKLVEEGKLPLHHITDQNRFLRKADVLEYMAKKKAEAKGFFDTQIEDTEPPSL
ncbi:excisionase family DNA binding protein [Paraburkholderia sp. BL6669N2]|uniref:helix-turn-helix domain-containing protein n=1 Tax=Paraburkholderia sp. BL6669N2 TaxID=1938807 RepID=UPI000E23D916|nr:helix-turn-helix domain-containing protein [Paraburkholderia sp. BL6669N2]REG59665.1 excisionase family DNA binding protein [Paraburkholderia sp. BL6669N2]